jgi:glutamate dehydrogenase (NAD(P)+)
MAETRTPSMLRVFNEHFNRAAHYVKAPADLLEYIRSCHSMYSLKFPVRIRGEVQIFHAYRAEHSHHSYTHQGCIRFARTLTSTKWRRWQP